MPTPRQKTCALRTRKLNAQAAVEDPAFDAVENAQLPIGPALRKIQERKLRDRIRCYLAAELDLTVTDNRAVMITVRRVPKLRQYSVRLHQIFVDAPDEITRALARFIELNDREASQQLSHFIDAHEDDFCERRSRPREAVIRTAGRMHDLAAIFEAINYEYFDAKIEARITWGRHVRRGHPRSTVRLGSYTVEEQLIRIHPGLDRSWVPEYYLRWVVYHEMLHAAFPVETINGRRCFHSVEFAAAERRYSQYELVHEWERRHLASLLRI